ncbi:MAG: O-methyltransferase [Acidimicrobiia bacterium]
MASSDPKGIFLNIELARYLSDHSTPPDQVLMDLVDETRRAVPHQMSMQISADQGRLLTMLVQLTGARNIVEVGTFTGYSSICLARGLPADGHLLCCDVSEDWTAIARRYWEKAGVDGRIELKLGPAADTLRSLPEEPQFDLAFIDADKGGNRIYYEEILNRLRPGGLICVDNVLWSGRVVDPLITEGDTQVIRDFNELVVADDRVTVVILAVADGLSLIRKK